MSFQQILNIAIVICGIYAGLSCLCSWVNERIAAFLALRGWNLFRGIANLLGTDQLAAMVFNHPLVAANSPKPNQLVDASGTTTLQRFWSVAVSRPPSYLDARNFSSALWQVLPGVQPPDPAPVNADQNNSGATTVATAQALAAAPSAAVAALKDAVGKLGPQHAKLRLQLQALLAQAGDDYTKLLAATDAWFNAEMDRVSGWYARQTQWIIVVIAFFMVSFAGVDTLEMVRTLSITSAADLSAISNNILDQACSKAAFTNLKSQCPSPSSNSSSGVPVPAASPAITSVTNGPTNNNLFDVTQFAHVQIGFANWAALSKTKSGLEYYRWQGMLLTWVALALGGPFWFNLLCSFANVRAAGKKPDDSSTQSVKT